MEDQFCEADVFDQGISTAPLGNLLAQDWIVLKDHLVGPWGIFPEGFQLKYSRIHVINLSYKFENPKTHKTYQVTLEHISMFQGLTLECLGRLTSK